MIHRIVKKFKWEMGHRLWNYVGPCGRMHGHSYVAEVEFQSACLDDTGFVLDFADAKLALQGFIDRELDHRFMVHYQDPLLQAVGIVPNVFRPELIALDVNPTAENIALLLAQKSRDFCLDYSNTNELSYSLTARSVIVHETATGRAQVDFSDLSSLVKWPKIVGKLPSEA